MPAFRRNQVAKPVVEKLMGHHQFIIVVGLNGGVLVQPVIKSYAAYVFHGPAHKFSHHHLAVLVPGVGHSEQFFKIGQHFFHPAQIIQCFMVVLILQQIAIFKPIGASVNHFIKISGHKGAQIGCHGFRLAPVPCGLIAQCAPAAECAI